MQKRKQKSDWVLYFCDCARAPQQRQPRLVVRGVPAGARVTYNLLEQAGFRYGKPRWANHFLTRVAHNSELAERIRRGEYEAEIDYRDLVAAAGEDME